MRSLRVMVPSAALLALGAGAALADVERVTFELPDTTGKVVRSADLTSRYTLLVYQGMP